MQNRLFFFFCIIFSLVIEAQELHINQYDAIIHATISNNEKIERIERILQTQRTQNQNFELAEIYYQFSKWNWMSNNDESRAKKYAIKEYSIRSKNINKDKDKIKRNLYNLGFMHHHSRNPDYTNALNYFETLINISKPNEKRIGNTYREMGDIYDELGDFYRALESYKKSERILKRTQDKNLLLKTYINISQVYARLNDSTFENSFFENLRKIKKLEEKITISDDHKIILLLNTGAVYKTVNNLKKAIETYSNALKLAKNVNNCDYTFGILNNLGVLYTKKKYYKKAELLFSKSLIYTVDNIRSKSIYYNNMADLFMSRCQYQKAIKYYQKSIICLLPGFEFESSKNLNIEEIKYSPHLRYFLDHLIDKAKALETYYHITFERELLIEAEKNIALADQIIDILFLESREEISKLFWRKKGSDLYSHAVSICYELQKPTDAFYYIEKNKGVLLLANITDAHAKRLSKIPTNIINREYQISTTIKQLQLSINKKHTSQIFTDSINDQIFLYKNKYENLIDSIETAYPNYYNYKKKIKIKSVKYIQESIKENEWIIEYIIGDNDAYACLLSKDSIKLKRIFSLPKLKKTIKEYKKSISRPLSTFEEVKEFNKIANDLFILLFPFESFRTNLKNIKLCVIPDGILENIPFESLIVSNKDSNLTNDYLINNCEVYYNYSISIASFIESFKKNKSKNIISFTPIEFKNNYLPSLEKTKEEIETIKSFSNTKIYKDTLATKSNFIKKYNDSFIIHISTHGGVINDRPWLAFYDKKMQFDELYSLNSQKELVILSACKTLLGKYNKGEGQYSFTRGFIKAGAKSVLSSLWDINEKSNNEIISTFYHKIQDGQEKSKALRDAKLLYLKKYRNTSQASPYFWSSIIISGDNNPIFERTSLFDYKYFIILILVLLMLFIRFKKNIL